MDLQQAASILLIEDDAGTASEITQDLSGRGYSVALAETGPDGLTAARSGSFDLLIVDRMLPELDGLSVIEALRHDQARLPILVLSALGSIDDRVRGLKAGGDDYLTKPFALVELAARVEALLRRPTDSRQTVLRVGPLTFDLIERAVWRGERRVELLPRELKILDYMMRRHGQVITREMLLEEVWGYRFLPQSNLVDVHLGKLRRKIDLAGEPPLFHVLRGTGFLLKAPDEAPPEHADQMNQMRTV